MSYTVDELREFIRDLPGNTEVVIESIYTGEKIYCSPVFDITFHKIYNPHIQRLVLIPTDVIVE